MELFARCDRETERLLAVTEEGKRYTLGDLNAAAERIAGAVGEHRLVFVLCENTPGTLLGYLGCLKAGEVPLLLDAHIAPELLRGLLETYRPAFVHVPGDLPAETGRVLEGFVPALEVEDSVLLRRPGGQGPELHPELALLLTTSGSTGSPKLVRLSGRNLDANTRSIVEYLELDEGQRPVTNLAMSYSYGMSIVNTHLLAGAALVLTRRSVLERPFWELVERERVTSLAGVPYTYRMYRRAGLLEMELPALNTLTQAGGKLPEALHLEFADWAARTGRRFFVMYGQTEAAPRMGYLPAERAVEKCGSMGVPVPGGQFRLLGEDGAPLTRRTPWASWSTAGPTWPWATPGGRRSWPWGTSGTGSSTPAIWPGGTGMASTTSWAARSGLSSSTATGWAWTRWNGCLPPFPGHGLCLRGEG